jgi:hypothetical protein
MFMVYDLNVFQIVFNHKQFENKKTGLKIEGVTQKKKLNKQMK